MVSFVQACVINSAALCVMYLDVERREWDWKQRVWGYSGAVGMIQGFSAGYFLWDLLVCIQDVEIQGAGALAHAVSALAVSSLGFVSSSDQACDCGASLRNMLISISDRSSTITG